MKKIFGGYISKVVNHEKLVFKSGVRFFDLMHFRPYLAPSCAKKKLLRTFFDTTRILLCPLGCEELFQCQSWFLRCAVLTVCIKAY